MALSQAVRPIANFKVPMSELSMNKVANTGIPTEEYPKNIEKRLTFY
jgi:hypothetical protein